MLHMKSGIKPSKNNTATVTVFITFKDADQCKILRNTWSIEINKQSDLVLRKKFREIFIRFDELISPSIIHEAYVAQNPKHIFWQSPDKFIIEFESEADLFNACDKMVHFQNYVIKVKPTQDEHSQNVKITYEEYEVKRDIPSPSKGAFKPKSKKIKTKYSLAADTSHYIGTQANSLPLGKPVKMDTLRAHPIYTYL
ncbi:hypothetical protein GLOIN_2v1485434 [Rhizophagus clarus]|uniref:Uncharacterized protein n=1 Tax=Rhizophagus clarus TaxID=94130 RepID=A0A8H3L7X3_9GLOM|nr:hypothetical protein GLOIN_2v1485434 [Rhizophagus clarus]